MKNVQLSIMEDDLSNELPTRRETLTETLKSFVTVGNSGIGSIVMVLIGIVMLAWIADSLFAFAQDLSSFLFAQAIAGKPLETKFLEQLSRSIIPIFSFLILIGFLFWLRRRNLAVPSYSISTPVPHEGLIVMLSVYRQIRGERGDVVGYQTCDELDHALTEGSVELDKVFNGCNWGQTLFVAKFHAAALKNLWVVTTPESSIQFEIAKRLFSTVTIARVNQAKIKNYNNIGEVARKISQIFRQSDLRGDQIISDITGGTSAMTGGMILATLDEGRKIEYVKQRVKLGEFSAKKIIEDGLIISPNTSFQMAKVFSNKT